MKPLFFTFIFITFFFQKPLWCERRGADQMTEDCNYDTEGNRYFISGIVQIPDKFLLWSSYISYLCQFLIVAPDLILIIFVTRWQYRLRILTMASMLVLEILMNAGVGMGLLP